MAVNIIKLQYLLIGIAGNKIWVSFGNSKPKQDLQYYCFVEYCFLVDQYLNGKLLYLPQNHSSLNGNHFMRVNSCLLDGPRIWYMFQCSARYVISQINPMFRELREGETFVDLCFEIREKLWDKKHFVLRSRRKSQASTPLPPFDGEWEPNEWFLFLYCGVNGIVSNCYSNVLSVYNSDSVSLLWHDL
jgi:hypothetical protein